MCCVLKSPGELARLTSTPSLSCAGHPRARARVGGVRGEEEAPSEHHLGVGMEQVFGLMFEVVGAAGEFFDERQGLPPLVPHQADCGLVHDTMQHQQVLVLVLLLAHEVVGEVSLQLGALLVDVAKVDEEPRTHVALQVLDLLRPGGLVVPHQEVAVLQQPASSDLFGVPRGDQLLVQVVEGLLEVPVDGLGHHGGVEVVAHGHLGAAVEEQQRVQDDLERVDAELELAAHRVDELELDVAAAVVAEANQAPPVTGGHLLREKHSFRNKSFNRKMYNKFIPIKSSLFSVYLPIYPNQLSIYLLIYPHFST